jgi:7-cyano-7-deazaguanine synthase
MKAIVLLSGGLDSATCGAIARADGFDLFALSFRYGQRHVAELRAAERIARRLDVVEHKIVDIDLRSFGGSALTDDIDVPTNRSDEEMEAEIPVTYVPARNTIFLSYALAFSEVRGISDIFIGVNAVDYSGYPDCRPEFIQAFENMANKALKMSASGERLIRIQTPILNLKKADIIKRGTELGIDYSLTVSCYNADEAGRACGECDSCLLRKRGFETAGIPDPTHYRQ